MSGASTVLHPGLKSYIYRRKKEVALGSTRGQKQMVPGKRGDLRSLSPLTIEHRSPLLPGTTGFWPRVLPKGNLLSPSTDLAF